MAKRMLIDATHPEETRVVALNGNKLDEFDFETESKKQLKGNIYLAKVTRVEPSLQAAFVEYGGNRHGFLPFAEIHPDYYRIPVADRQAMLDQARREQAEAGTDGEAGGDGAAGGVETVGGDEAEEVQRPHPKPTGSYKIQEVIKRKQILLVQVAKEERGTKGAALTTFISLAGRYTVLMPNNATGGGVSRKITSAKDRKRLRKVLEGLQVPDGMSLILRTAGMERTKAEIKRDYDYLLRLWDSIRERTLNSVAPTLIYEEANLIKRAIRDLYTRDIEEVLVEGEDGYRTAKDFMRMLMPSHAKKVQPYRDQTVPLFHRYQVEQQIENILSPTVTLKSGGSIVLNPTEALVAIDVNSGKATKERNIEETAVKTNLEAADEIARQLRLRDLAGLIVIDFIDMESDKNNHAVEKRLKEAMKSDRARVQLGKISPFGLLELSRQRLRPSLMEISFEPSPDCGGTGYVRTVESSALHVLRGIEDEGIRGRSAEITVYLPPEVALYILNQKRSKLAAIEARYELRVMIDRDDTLYRPTYRLERERARPEGQDQAVAAIHVDSEAPPEPAEPETEEATAERGKTPAKRAETRGVEADSRTAEGRKRRRSRGGRRRRKTSGDGDAEGGDAEGATDTPAAAEAPASDGTEQADKAAEPAGETAAEAQARRRRGKRGGRRRSRRGEGEDGDGQSAEPAAAAPEDADPSAAPAAETAASTDTEQASELAGAPARKPRQRRRRRSAEASEASAEAAGASTPAATVAAPAAESASAAGPSEPAEEAPAAPEAAGGADAAQGDRDAPGEETAGEATQLAGNAPEAAAEPDQAGASAGAAQAPPPAEDIGSPSGDSERASNEAVNVPEPVLVDQIPAKRRTGWWRRG